VDYIKDDAPASTKFPFIARAHTAHALKLFKWVYGQCAGPSPRTLNEWLWTAAARGWKAGTRVCLEWGASGYARAIYYAAANGHDPVVDACFRWMVKTVQLRARTVNQALRGYDPAEFENSALCAYQTFGRHINKIAKNHGLALSIVAECLRKIVQNFNAALVSAAKTGRCDAMLVCIKWGATNYNAALLAATSNEKLSAMMLCLNMGANNIDEALSDAAAGSLVGPLVVCKVFGARGFLEAAAAANHAWVAKLCRGWLGARTEIETGVRTLQ
jgi:hypothetical protein